MLQFRKYSRITMILLELDYSVFLPQDTYLNERHISGNSIGACCPPSVHVCCSFPGFIQRGEGNRDDSLLRQFTESLL